MSFQIGCSVEECVTISASKRLEDCINVAQVAFMVVVSQKPHIFPKFLHTLFSKFFDIWPIHNVYIINIDMILTYHKNISEFWVLADHHQLEYHSYGLFETDWGWGQ